MVRKKIEKEQQRERKRERERERERERKRERERGRERERAREREGERGREGERERERERERGRATGFLSVPRVVQPGRERGHGRPLTDRFHYGEFTLRDTARLPVTAVVHFDYH